MFVEAHYKCDRLECHNTISANALEYNQNTTHRSAIWYRLKVHFVIGTEDYDFCTWIVC